MGPSSAKNKVLIFYFTIKAVHIPTKEKKGTLTGVKKRTAELGSRKEEKIILGG